MRVRNAIISAGCMQERKADPATGTNHAVAVIVHAFHPEGDVLELSTARADPPWPRSAGLIGQGLRLVPLSAPPPARFVRELGPVIAWPASSRRCTACQKCPHDDSRTATAARKMGSAGNHLCHLSVRATAGGHCANRYRTTRYLSARWRCDT